MLTIYDPTQDDSLGAIRGAGRTISILKENFTKEARFVTSLSKVAPTDTLLIPTWKPFDPPLLTHNIAETQILILFDAIPLKYPEHFPIGLKGRWTLFKNLRSLNVYDKILTISEHAKDDLAEYLNLEPNIIENIYITTSKRFFKPGKLPTKTTLEKKYNLPKKYILYVGDTNWNKNLVNMAHACIQADVEIVCVGKSFTEITKIREMDREKQNEYIGLSKLLNHPEQDDFKEFVKLALHDERFHFPGYITDTELIALYRNALCNILVSRDEGFGLSYLEAATQKTPSVLSDTPIFQEIAKKSAIFAEPEKAESIAAAITQLTSSKRKRESYGKKAYARSAFFSPEKFTQRLIKATQS